MKRCDFQPVYAGLKDFQADTVNYVFRRMYTDTPPARRFLVADEVGLGKTLVARGLIARAIDHLWDEIDRIDVVYICSNGDIARQNIRRLNVTGQSDFAFAQRLTLMALQMKDLTKNKVNFVSFTPGTSFDLKDAMGWSRERALLFWLVQQVWGEDVVKPTRKGDLHVFRGWSRLDRFRHELGRMRTEVASVDRGLVTSFRRSVAERERVAQSEGRPTLRSRYEDLRRIFAHDKKTRPPQDWRERTRFIGELRAILARSIVDALEPDLVILDEFQRFKSLLTADTDAARLAHELFDYSDEYAAARVLLLSATPYKMYTLAEESEDDDHYADFIRTTGFLMQGDTAGIESDLAEFRRSLLRVGTQPSTVDTVLAAKDRLELQLRSVMARTERLAVSSDRNGMLAEQPPLDGNLEAQDLAGYLAFDRFATALEGSGNVEYWKSAPYFPNFMDGYQLGKLFERAQGDPARMASALSHLDTGIIDWEGVRDYEPVEAGNPRLRGLVEDLLDTGGWRLLWMPPTLPYYEPGQPFSDPKLAGFTKRLVFSAWNAVPRSVASILSYEAERRMMHHGHADRENTPEARAKLTELLKFTESKGRLTGMPVLAMLYPSTALADLGDPLRITTELRAAGERPSLDNVVRVAKQAIRDALRDLPAGDGGREDDAWYWATPLLVDQLRSQASWIGRDGVIPAYTGDGTRGTAGFAKHVEAARRLLAGELTLGKRPDDLVDVLALLAVAGPANTALRALRLMAPDIPTTPEIRDAAARVAWEFRGLFNLPEVRYLVRPLFRGRQPYWQKVLRYCAAGNLQSVLDEYVHTLREWLGILDPTSEGAAMSVGRVLANSVSLRSVNYFARDPHAPYDEGRRAVRARFALQFGQRSQDEEGELQRSEQVRGAFNSPFWPFVLVSTSIGQEGLDFHLYCHAIVHWNLPSNPVDLEQREGRVHRYKGHAIRRNLAQRHQEAAFEGPVGDPWQKMFDAAVASRDDNETDLVPYWVLPGDSFIQRHVPALPLSREVPRLANLKRTLALYRLVFGQPRQEDLVEYLLAKGMDDSQIEDLVERLRIDLRPR